MPLSVRAPALEASVAATLQRMALSSEDRRRARRPRATDAFGTRADAALDALALLDFAWHDMAQFVSAAHLAVIDFRDLRMCADDMRR